MSQSDALKQTDSTDEKPAGKNQMVVIVAVVALIIVLAASIIRSLTAPPTSVQVQAPTPAPQTGGPTVQDRGLESFLGSFQNASVAADRQDPQEGGRVGRFLQEDLNLETPITAARAPSEFVTAALRDDINGNVVVEVQESPTTTTRPQTVSPTQNAELAQRSADLSGTLERLREVNQRASRPGYSEEQALQDLAYIEQPAPDQNSAAAARSATERMIPPGTVIQSVLQNELNSDVSSSYVAIIKYPIYDSRRSHVLVPVGSRLYGRITRGQAVNEVIQNRLTLTVEGIVRPDDTLIDLQSAVGLDNSGAGGLQGSTDHHFWARTMGAFGFAILSIAPSITVSEGEPQSSVDEATGAAAQRFGEAFTPLAQQYASIVPTKVVPAGTALNVVVELPVFVEPYSPVARPVDFGGI